MGFYGLFQVSLCFLEFDSFGAVTHGQKRRSRRIVQGMKTELKNGSSYTSATRQCGPEVTLLSIGQTAQLSGVSEADLLGLVEYGVLTSSEPETGPRTFDIGCVMKLQRAALMRHDLALDAHGFALTMMFLNDITGLEAQLHSAQCDLRDCRSLGPVENLLA
jgi:chaperone modulatory protein CbpM